MGSTSGVVAARAERQPIRNTAVTTSDTIMNVLSGM